MTRYLLDTNHVSAVLNDRAPGASRIRSVPTAHVGVSLPSVGELWYMVYKSGRQSENRKRLMMVLRDLTLVDFDQFAAIEFGKLKAELERIGKLIPTADIQIAAVARAHGLVLLTADAHFSFVSGITCEDWTA